MCGVVVVVVVVECGVWTTLVKLSLTTTQTTARAIVRVLVLFLPQLLLIDCINQLLQQHSHNNTLRKPEIIVINARSHGVCAPRASSGVCRCASPKEVRTRKAFSVWRTLLEFLKKRTTKINWGIRKLNTDIMASESAALGVNLQHIQTDGNVQGSV